MTLGQTSFPCVGSCYSKRQVRASGLFGEKAMVVRRDGPWPQDVPVGVSNERKCRCGPIDSGGQNGTIIGFRITIAVGRCGGELVGSSRAVMVPTPQSPIV